MLHAGKTPSEALCMQHYRFISPNKLGLVANTNAVVPLHSLLPLQWQDSANLCFSSSSPPAEAELLQGSYSSLLGTGDQYQISFCSKYWTTTVWQYSPHRRQCSRKIRAPSLKKNKNKNKQMKPKTKQQRQQQ